MRQTCQSANKKPGLVLAPEEWNWSNYRHYALGERGPVLVNEAREAEMRVRGIA
jgi:hypothetical protein